MVTIPDTHSVATGGETILIVAPTANDGVLAANVLKDAGFEARVCSDLGELCIRVAAEDDGYLGTGVILIAEEAFTVPKEQEFIKLLESQPPWSDIPIVLLTSGNEKLQASLRALDVFGSSGNVTFLERPLQAITLISAIHVALRSRRRQYQIRDLLDQRERSLATISAAREEAEGANRMKDQFLATLSHELRTPLNAILGWGQILREELSDNRDSSHAETIAQGIEVIERNAKVQAQLIEDLLDVSRIISGKLLIEYKPVDIAKVVTAARDSVAIQAESKGVALELSIPNKLPPVLGDAARLQQIVWNLLSNAVKFTPPSGTIYIDAFSGGDDVRISIRDTGEGMTAEFLPFVFDRFRQADASITRRQGGLGLGLSIVRQLVDLHKGTVSVESGGLSKGSTFTLTFPAAEMVSQESNDDSSLEGKPAKATPQNTVRSLDGIRVLVVDNEPDALDLIKRLLVESHAEVEVADSVPSAMRALEVYRPDILISDIGMPDEDGYDLIRKIRALPGDLANIPAVALTAYASTEDRNRSRLAGFQLHLAKPVDFSELRSVVASLV
jgi:signal transduction histidine kinase